MCQFFSLVTEPKCHGRDLFYFDWKYRKSHLQNDNHDSHSFICRYFRLNEDICNKYEYNPLTNEFKVDKINSEYNDSMYVKSRMRKLDFSRIVEPLIIKSIINPLELPIIPVTNQHVNLLVQWAGVWDSVWAGVWDSIWDNVGDSVRENVRVSVWDNVGDSVWDSVGASVRASVREEVRASVREEVRARVWDSVWVSVRARVWDSVRASVGAYVSSFFSVAYEHDFTSVIRLWEDGLVPSFHDDIWRLHQGKEAEIVFEISTSELSKYSYE